MKLTQVEKCWLVALFCDGYRWLARDGYDDNLIAYKSKPFKNNPEYWNTDSDDFLYINTSSIFKQIKCSDSVPFKITCKMIPLDMIGIEKDHPEDCVNTMVEV